MVTSEHNISNSPDPCFHLAPVMTWFSSHVDFPPDTPSTVSYVSAILHIGFMSQHLNVM